MHIPHSLSPPLVSPRLSRPNYFFWSPPFPPLPPASPHGVSATGYRSPCFCLRAGHCDRWEMPFASGRNKTALRLLVAAAMA